jgi:hypothetical protein
MMTYEYLSLIAFSLWIFVLSGALYIVWKNRKNDFFLHRTPVVMVLTQLFTFISALVVAISFWVDICTGLNCIYAMSTPICMIPLYLMIPNAVLRSELNEMMSAERQDLNNWRWKFRWLYSTRGKLLLIFVITLIQLGLLFLIKYTIRIDGDCQLHAIYLLIITQVFYFIPMIIFAFRLKKINDPHSIRLEIGATVVAMVPGVIALFLFIAGKLPFRFQYAYIYAITGIFVCNLILPVAIFLRRPMLKAHSNEDISALIKDEGFSRFCITRLANENVLFCRAVTEYRNWPTQDKALEIFDEYIAREAPKEVNLEASVVKDIRAKIISNSFEQNLFDPAFDAVKVLLAQNIVPHYRHEITHFV